MCAIRGTVSSGLGATRQATVVACFAALLGMLFRQEIAMSETMTVSSDLASTESWSSAAAYCRVCGKMWTFGVGEFVPQEAIRHVEQCRSADQAMGIKESAVPVERCKHNVVIDPTGNYVCMKCFREPDQSTGANDGK